MTRPVYYELPKEPAEIVFIPGFDFTNSLRSGETIASQLVTIFRRSDNVDVTATVWVSGSTTVAGNVVSFSVQSGTHNVDYYADVKITTNQSREYHGTVMLFVRERPY